MHLVIEADWLEVSHTAAFDTLKHALHSNTIILLWKKTLIVIPKTESEHSAETLYYSRTHVDECVRMYYKQATKPVRVFGDNYLKNATIL